jgi:cell division protein FtsB
MSEQKTKQIGRKILYIAVITLSVVIILFSSLGLIGVWMVQRPLSEAVVSFLVLVEESANLSQQVTEKVDIFIERAEEITTSISTATAELSGEVTDKGVVMVLLPEENELQLTETVNSAQETFAEIRGVIENILNLYQTVDSIPFVNLPGLSEDQLEGVTAAIDETSEKVAALRAEIEAFRSGVTEKIDLVADATAQLTADISELRSGLARLDSSLAEIESLAKRLLVIVPGLFIGSAAVLTLLFAFIIYTQIEVIRLYTIRWKQLGGFVSIEEVTPSIEPESVNDEPGEEDEAPA